jgi:hypothetical protein
MAGDRKTDLLVDELRQAVGEEALDRADVDVDRALERQPSRIGATLRSARLLLLVVGGALLVIGVVASLALDNWLFLGVAVVAHGLVSAVVIASALALAGEGEKPGPTAEAALEEEGVEDPGAALGDLVDQVGGRRRASS